MISILKTIEHHTQKAFAAETGNPAFGNVQLSDRPDLSDYQCNGALAAAKSLKTNPRALAEKILSTLDLPGIEIFIAGPGFLNFKLSDACIKEAAQNQLSTPTLGYQSPTSPKKIFVDYGGPNAAKPMHVGHLRSSIIGESLKRLLRFTGNTVIGDIHLGDWGTQMGMLIIGLKQQHPEWIYFQENADPKDFPKDPPFTLEDLETLYPTISAAAKEDEVLATTCREAIATLQKGHPGYTALWQHFVHLSVADMKKQFDALGISFDQWFGESRYAQKLPGLVEACIEKGIAHESEGAIILPVAEATDKQDIPPLLLQKKDGGYLYGTTDLATLQERVEEFCADEIIYVVDGRQALHFEQVFRGGKKLGLSVDTKFIGFGTMNGEDNKPFKTREGGVMRLATLIALLREEAGKKIEAANIAQDLSPEAREEIAQKIGIAALKFADLQHDPRQNYQFNLDKFMRFEGKTGPYLQYALVRIQALQEKLGHIPPKWAPTAFTPEERELLMHLLNFPQVIQKAVDALAPNVLCEHAYALAQSFSRFYAACPIGTCADPTIQQARMHLLEFTQKALKTYLGIIGIDVPEKM